MPNEAPLDSTLDLTPAGSGNASTTPPEAVNTGATPTEGGNQDAIDKIVKQRLERERKKWEADRVEAEKRARMDEADRLKAELADRDARIEAAELKALTAERLADLTGKVIDPKAALRLWEEDDTLDSFLKRHPYMAPNPDRLAAPAPTAPNTGSTRPLRPEDLKGQSFEWIAANRHRLKNQR